MIEINGQKLYTYEELFPIANKELIKEDEYLAVKNGCKILYDKDKFKYSKVDIGKWLKLNGYKRIRKQIRKVSRYYYIKVSDIKGYLFIKNGKD